MKSRDQHIGVCHIYSNYDVPGVQGYQIRVAPVEDSRFPQFSHGFAVANTFTDPDKAIQFAKDVNKYLQRYFKRKYQFKNETRKRRKTA